MSNPNGTALSIFEGMAVICDCDSEQPATTPQGHEDDCEVTSAWHDAQDAANESFTGIDSDAYAALDDDPTYHAFDGDDVDWLD
jgi:DNA-binding IscR family transcriptional regulator